MGPFSAVVLGTENYGKAFYLSPFLSTCLCDCFIKKEKGAVLPGRKYFPLRCDGPSFCRITYKCSYSTNYSYLVFSAMSTWFLPSFHLISPGVMQPCTGHTLRHRWHPTQLSLSSGLLFSSFQSIA